MKNHRELLKAGDWVTQYKKGIWQVMQLKPKYAEENTQIDGTSYLKGDLIGQWIIMKKAFSSKIKFQIDFDVCDSFWCHKVTKDVLVLINSYFKNNPLDMIRFNNANYIEKPAICCLWINMPEKHAGLFLKALSSLPPLFTMPHLISILNSFQTASILTLRPPSNFVLYLQHTLWEYDEKHEPLYKNPAFLKNDDSLRAKLKKTPGYY